MRCCGRQAGIAKNVFAASSSCSESWAQRKPLPAIRRGVERRESGRENLRMKERAPAGGVEAERGLHVLADRAVVKPPMSSSARRRSTADDPVKIVEFEASRLRCTTAVKK